MSSARSDTRPIWRGPLLAWFALVVLFGISLGSAYLPLGAGNGAANLLIAVVMAIVLAVFLMDLRNATILIRVVAVAGLFWTVMMFALTFSDYLNRN